MLCALPFTVFKMAAKMQDMSSRFGMISASRSVVKLNRVVLGAPIKHDLNLFIKAVPSTLSDLSSTLSALSNFEDLRCVPFFLFV